MVFKPMSWVPQLPEIPDTVPICDFMLDEKHGRVPASQSKNAYTCGLSGKSISAQQQKKNVEFLSRALAKEFGWKVNEGTEYDKVAGVFALNTVWLPLSRSVTRPNAAQIEIMTLNWAIHRLNGVSSPANAAYNADELRHQLTNSGSKVLFTVMPLLQTALDAAAKANISRKNVYICELPGDSAVPKEFKTLSQLMKEGESLPALEPIKWEKGQGARQTAFLCYSSGTSGLPVSNFPNMATRHLLALTQILNRKEL
jgi:acyl-CoA synthetase (AMP-forming)/AMP-acid ligase II